MPTNWRNHTLVSTYKNKRDIQTRVNCRAIKLMNYLMKLLEIIIEQKFKKKSECEKQFGFRKINSENYFKFLGE